MQIKTKNIFQDKHLTAIKQVVEILDSLQITEVEILYGISWGNEFYEWEAQKCKLRSVIAHIHATEAKSKVLGDTIENSDFSIFARSVEIKFSYQDDIQLSFETQNAIVDALQVAFEFS